MEKRVVNGETEWRRDQEVGPLGLFITDGGLLALGLDEPEKEQLPKAAAGKTRQNKKPAARPLPKARKAVPGGTKKRGTHTQTKQDLVILMLRRQSGVSVDDIIAKTDWQPHSVRGFFSGVVRKKFKLTLVSNAGKDGVRRYRTTPVTLPGMVAFLEMPLAHVDDEKLRIGERRDSQFRSPAAHCLLR